MSTPIDIKRAWNDEEYRNNLTPQQLAQLPPNPANGDELSEEELDDITGGSSRHGDPQPQPLHIRPPSYKLPG